MRPAVVVLLAWSAAVRPADGQFRPERVQSRLPAERRTAADTVAYAQDTGGAVLGAVVFGGLGLMAGYYTGDLEALLWSEAVGLALGAHIGNGGRGNPLAPLLASVGVMAAARLAAEHVDLRTEDFVLFVPLLQVALAVAAEMGTTPRRASR